MGVWIEQNLPTVITLLVMAGGGLVAFTVLRERQSSFEKACAEQFRALKQESTDAATRLNATMTEIGRDVKTVVGWMNREQGRDEGRRVGRRHDDDIPVDRL
jgi:hypothetical protein